MNNTISISALNKADVLAALYNSARPIGMGYLQAVALVLVTTDGQTGKHGTSFCGYRTTKGGTDDHDGREILESTIEAAHRQAPIRGTPTVGVVRASIVTGGDDG